MTNLDLTSRSTTAARVNFARLQPTSNRPETGNGRAGGDRPYEGGHHGRRQHPAPIPRGHAAEGSI